MEVLSNIKSHTIRIWEKRYDILQPERTSTNIRFYTNDDLKKLLNVSFLNQNGYKISKIAELSEEARSQLVMNLTQQNTENELYIDQLIVAMIDLNEYYFRNIFQSVVQLLGLEESFTQVIYPFLERIGIMWQTGAIIPAQEHFISHLVRHKIIGEIENLSVELRDDLPKIVLLLPGNELHEIALLLYQYALKKRAYPTIYLGQSVPIDSLQRIKEIAHPQFIVAHMTNPLNSEEVQMFLTQLDTFNGHVFLSGYATQLIDVSEKSNIHVVKDLEDLLHHINQYS